MRSETLEIISKIIKNINNIFTDISPYARSVAISNDFKSLLKRLSEINRIEFQDSNIQRKIESAYLIADSYPKCLPPTENCRREHYEWGLKVNEAMFDLIKIFKSKGYDFEFEGDVVKAPEVFKLTEENIIKIGFVAVVAIIIMSILKGR
ncbi:MAG: hypothetical protein RMJ67_06005 [Elusimicrobiota bacterium]|nr:hypothetical protein [Endomicrobiia bacterium]MDW8166046.1 hypothetical protein [Elusimicrobiota bacterium]